ncbi:MAG: beta strand repeat-containing protein [Pyrinomonadaceae bacterium]
MLRINTRTHHRRFAAAALTLLLLCAAAVQAQTSAFTYQGRLTDAGSPASGTYDFEFRLYDAAGAQIGAALTREDVPVANGTFNVTLDFGASAFNGDARLLEISVRSGASTDTYTTLAPRQNITSAPYSIRALSAAQADAAQTTSDAEKLGGVAASQYVQTNDERLSDARIPLAGSTNYIQNRTAAVQAGSFNLLGSGTLGGTLFANIVNSQTQYNLNDNRVLSVSGGGSNLFAGYYAGTNNLGNTGGSDNSFFGESAGYSNTMGNSNAFIGSLAGYSNKSGNGNAFLGASAGYSNTTGNNNSFVGITAGERNTTGGSNSFFGLSAGSGNKTGSNNSFVGSYAGESNTTGNFNTSVGTNAGSVNATGDNNTFIGASADATGDNLTNATAVGANATVSASNSVVLGSGANVGIGTTAPAERLHVVGNARIEGNLDVTGTMNLTNLDASSIATGTLNSARLGTVPVAKGGTGLTAPGTVGSFLRSNGTAWTSAPLAAVDVPAGSASYIQNQTAAAQAGGFNLNGSGTLGGTLSGNVVNSQKQYNLGGSRVLSTAGNNNLFAGIGAGTNNTGFDNSFFGSIAGQSNTTGEGNTFVGTNAGYSNTSGNSNALLGFGAGYFNTTGGANSSLGAYAGQHNTTGDNNTFVGAGADTSGGSLSNATAIGANAKVSANNSIVLGDSTISVNVGIGTTAPHSRLHVASGYVQLPVATGVPPAADCAGAADYGRMKVDAVNARLYVCTSSGWKGAALN